MTTTSTLAQCKHNGYTLLQDCIVLGSNGEWPLASDLLCWWCKHPFDTIPVPIPVRQGHLQPKYWTVGVCCSWSCVSAYRRRYYSQLSHASLHTFAVSVFGWNAGRAIHCAPDWKALRAFGGCLDIHTFRKAANEQLEIQVHMECLRTVPRILCARHDPSEEIAKHDVLDEQRRKMALDAVVRSGGVNIFKQQQRRNGVWKQRTTRERHVCLHLDDASPPAVTSPVSVPPVPDSSNSNSSGGKRQRRRRRAEASSAADPQIATAPVKRRRRGAAPGATAGNTLHKNYTPSTVAPLTNAKAAFLKKSKTNTLDRLWTMKPK